MIGKRHNPHLRKLIAGYDGSNESGKAVDVAASLAECADTGILIFAVALPPETSISVGLEAMLDDANEHVEEGFELQQ